MKINEVKKLDDGVSGIITEGRIIRVLKPRESQYGLSQFVVIKDDTDEMGSNINIENEEAKYQGGEYIQIKGKVSHYVKGGKPNVSLNGNVVDEIVKDEDVSQEKPTQPVEKTREKPREETMENVYPGHKITRIKEEYTNSNYWRDKAQRDIENNKCIVRECAIKAVSEEAVINLFNILNEKQYFNIADKIKNYIYDRLEIPKSKPITSEAITKEFGGIAEEDPKVIRIEQARELIRNPHLTEPTNDKMATIPQKKQIYGYINEEGKKIRGMVDSQYIKKEEVKNIGKAQDLTKASAIKYWEYWYGKDEEVGERDKREIEAKDKEGNPLVKEKPLEKINPNDTSSLVKDLLVEAIYKQRKELHLEDDKKFEKTIGYNSELEELTEEKLLKLKELLCDWKPDWITE